MRKILICGGVIAAVIIIGFFTVHAYVRSLGPRAQTRVSKALSDRFDADVSLQNLQLYLFPVPRAVGGPLTIRHRGWNDPHPLIYIRHFVAEASVFNLFFQRDKVSLLKLDGLTIHVPHRGKATSVTTREDDETTESGEPGQDKTQLRIGIAKIVADGTLLQIDGKDPAKEPMEFNIRNLNLRSVGPGQAMRFDAVLHNPKPPGLINTRGHFGPWQKEDPRATAVSGEYAFSNADLSVFKGIRGILCSSGKYSGVLQHIEVEGQTDTPDFALRKGGSPVHLRTKFRSTVNGINGDTLLENIDATFLHSEFLCKGGVVKQAGDKGKTVNLYAKTQPQARMEDILTLVMPQNPPIMTGDVQFQSKIVIPPMPVEVIRKLQLDGDFQLRSATFTNPRVNEKIVTLSDRARGITKEEQDRLQQQTVASDLSARFRLDNGVMTLTPLSFAVPGATIRLHGTYNMPSRTLDLQGLFRMHARLSDTQSGLKHWLLIPIDPILAKNGAGVELPFSVTGPEHRPVLTVSAFHHSFQVK
jgi:hypothetical protein